MHKNFTIDCVDQIAGAKDAAEVWQASKNIAASVGAHSLVTAEFHTGIQQLPRKQPSMSEAWIDEYVGADYASVDPLLKAVVEGQRTASVLSGQLDLRDEKNSKLDLDLDHNLKAAGYNYLTTGRYIGQTASTFRGCTMIADSETDFGKAGSRQHYAMEFVRGLIARSATGPSADNRDGQARIGIQKLTQRERECLSLLAEGKMTAGIAENLGIAEVTVNKHFMQAKKRLGASTREQALAIAMSAGALSF